MAAVSRWAAWASGWSTPQRASSSAGLPTRTVRLDASIASAITAGRAIIVPASHRAAALRLAWARHQQSASLSVWSSPEILTWDAWLARQWRAAVQRGTAPAAQLLSGSQERALWEQVLQELAADAGQASLSVHVAGLMQAAARATQSLLLLSRSAISEEEKLLEQALARLRELCAERNLVSLRMMQPAALAFLKDVAPPFIVGQPRLTALQQALQQQFWSEAPLLEPEPAGVAAVPVLRRAHSFEQELAACGAWCSERLRADGSARLLVLSACGEPSLVTQAALLWRHLAPGHRQDEALRNRLLGVEGGEALVQQALIQDALTALELAGPAIDTARLFDLLRSPYFGFGTQSQLWDLQGWFEKRGLARWEFAALRAALHAAAARERDLPAAAKLLEWLDALRTTIPQQGLQCASDWAQHFSDALGVAGFCQQGQLDSRDYQRWLRWGELLDEFAGLDAVLKPMPASEALRRLQRLAASVRHQAASGDAAITMADQLGDPVVPYDGIWVLALSENRWPASPRPDPYIALAEQRRSHWPESGVTERRAEARWALARWQQRTRELVLSYAEMEGDLHHRPTSLLGAAPMQWEGVEPADAAVSLAGHAVVARDEQLPAIDSAALAKPLSGGVERLRIQQECAFRAQAQWRLAARPPETLSDGITAALRGRLLHALLQSLWQALRDQSLLLALDAADEAALIERHWQAALLELPDAAWLPAGVLERERLRTARLLQRVLQLERERTPFRVEHCERTVEWQHEGARLRLRIDRMDRTPQGERLLLDYKSGAAGTMKLQHGELEPLQLALYVSALAAQGEEVAAAALMSLAPGDLRYAGVAAADHLLPDARAVEDWPATAALWQQGLQQLLSEHLSGSARLAQSLQICRYCKLPALCRRATADDVEMVDE